MRKVNWFLLSLVLIFVGALLVTVCLSGCTTADREVGIWCKHGTVVRINEGVVFGGTFTDWRDDIYFSDGTMLSSQERSLFGIDLNRTGRFYFEKNYFTYEGIRYKFDNFVRVVYDDDLYLGGVVR